MSHLDHHNILSDIQHCFRTPRSCESQLLIVTIDDLARCISVNESGQIDAILLDFSRAFDKVPHARLAKKLNHYGVWGKTLRPTWINRFLVNRAQQVVLEGKQSSTTPVTSWRCPPGHSVGPDTVPLLHQWPSEFVSSRARLFADDCRLTPWWKRLTSGRNIQAIEQVQRRAATPGTTAQQCMVAAELGWLSLAHRRASVRVLVMHSITNNEWKSLV